MYAAAERWRDEALVGDRSLFSGQPIDGLSAARELVRDFVERPDESARDFISKLRDQLAGTGSAGVQVAAELLYVHTLILSTDAFKSKNKLELVNNVIRIRDAGTTPVPDDLADALKGGVVRPGQAYGSSRWKMFAYLIRVFEAIKARGPVDRATTLTDWRAFQALLSEIDDQSVWAQRYALEHLLFPDVAPPILSRDDRAKIAQVFSAGEPSEDTDVIRLSAQLAPNVFYGDREGVNLYRTPYRERWQGVSDDLSRYADWSRRIMNSIRLDHVERQYKIDRVERLRAVFRAAEAGENPGEAVRRAFSSYNVVDFRAADTFGHWVKADPTNAAEALRALADRPGPESIDRFLTLVPYEAVPGLGTRLSIASALAMGLKPELLPPWRSEAAETTRRLAGGYPAQEAATAGEHYVNFLERLDAIRAVVNAQETLLRDRLDTQGLAWTIAKCPVDDIRSLTPDERAEFQAWRSGKPLPPPPPKPGPEKKMAVESLEQLAAQLYMASSEWLEETFTLLKDKRQLILQGPPGTGKTYIARELAGYLAGDINRVVTVQFHPGTSYEDFVQGLRPDPANPSRFKVVDGPLMRVSRAAAKDADKIHVLLIDEINRGNVPAVFGELYYLLEYRDESVTLLYGEQHALPKNLYIIGTMNTADRSITALDSALRRRFYVRDLDPQSELLQGILKTFLESNAPDLAWLAELLDLANAQLNDRDLAIGPSHFMGGNMSETWARRAWNNSVIPTLREYFHSNASRLSAFDFDTLKTQIQVADVSDSEAD